MNRAGFGLLALTMMLATACSVYEGSGSTSTANVSPSTTMISTSATSATTTPTLVNTTSEQAESQPEPGSSDATVEWSSAAIDDRPAPAPKPSRISIPSISVDAPITPHGLAPDGQMAVPDNIEEVAWYRFGATPGSQGSAVLAAHVDLAGAGPGVFFDLDTLQKGNLVTVQFADDTALSFIVESVERIAKTDLDVSALFTLAGEPTLRLVTCGGGFNPQLGRYDDNVVVTLTPTNEETP